MEFFKARKHWRAYASILGGFLICVNLGLFGSVGNLIPYVLSYIRDRVDDDIRLKDMIWILSLVETGTTSVLFLAGYLTDKFGYRLSALLGTVIFSACQIISAYTITVSYNWFLATYGFLTWIGGGLLFMPALVVATTWFPDSYGTATGVIGSGAGIGTLLWTEAYTLLINRENVMYNTTSIDNEGYFTDEDLLDRVPSVFWKISLAIGALNIIGTCLLFQKSSEIPNKEVVEVSSEIPQSEVTSIVEYLKRKEFYFLWMAVFLLMLPTLYIFSFLKSYGLSIIENDHEITYAVTFASTGIILGKIASGILLDKISYRAGLFVISLCLGCGIQLLYFCSYFPYLPFLICFALLGFIVLSAATSIYSVVPVCVMQMYGQHHCGKLIGLLSTSQLTASLLSTAIVQPLQDLLKWKFMFTLQLTFCLGSIVFLKFLPVSRVKAVDEGLSLKPFENKSYNTAT